MARHRLPPRDSKGQFRRRKNPRKPVRKNLDGFIGPDGKFHPVRGSKGYSRRLAGDGVWKDAPLSVRRGR